MRERDKANMMENTMTDYFNSCQTNKVGSETNTQKSKALKTSATKEPTTEKSLLNLKVEKV